MLKNLTSTVSSSHKGSSHTFVSSSVGSGGLAHPSPNDLLISGVFFLKNIYIYSFELQCLRLRRPTMVADYFSTSLKKIESQPSK